MKYLNPTTITILINVVFLYLLTIHIVVVQSQVIPVPACTFTDSTSGVKYDFTKLTKSEFSTTAGGYTYNLKICGTSEQTCPNDPDGITTGMGIQTKNTGGFGSSCYVLGQYDNSVTSANWATLDSGKGVSLTLANGTPSDCPEGTPRALQLNLECDTAETDDKFTIDNTDCEYTIHYKTCYACAKGCAGGGGGGGGGGGTPGEMTFFEIFFIVFISSLCVYCIGGVIFNVYKMERKGTEAIPNKQFWGALPGYVKDGFVFTGETTVNVVNRLRGQGGGGGGNLDYRPASPDTESYQGNDDGTFEKA